MNRSITGILFCTLAASIAACASTAPSHFYTLSPSVTSVAVAANYAVSIGPVSVPPIVDRPQIVTQNGPNQVVIDEFNIWASPLKGEIARVIVENLASILGTSQVTVFPQSIGAIVSYRVIIDVRRFDSAPGAATTLDALWTVRSIRTDKSHTGHTVQRESAQGVGFEALVASHSRALGRLSKDIADVIRELERSEQ